jgi:hypothetical protein
MGKHPSAIDSAAMECSLFMMSIVFMWILKMDALVFEEDELSQKHHST